MAGEMSQFDAETAPEWELHRSIARALGGEIRRFDVYQGPYIAPPHGGRIWVIDAPLRLYYEVRGREAESAPFGWNQTRRACRLARALVASLA